MRLSVLLGCALCLCLAVSVGARAQPPARVALVIGNSSYSGVWPDLGAGPLQNADQMRKVLTELSFEVVYRENADLAQMEQALDELSHVLQKHPGALALTYYAGHGALAPVRRQDGARDTESFLIPARTDLRNEADAPSKAIAQGRIEALVRAAGAASGVIILDAAHHNALERAPAPGAAPPRGLVSHAGTHMLVVNAAAPGRLAYNNRAGTSIFTATLAREISKPGTLLDALVRVRKDVIAETRGRPRGPQEPELYSTLASPIVLVDTPGAAAPQAAAHAEELAYLDLLKDLPPERRAAVCQDYRAKVGRGELPGSFAAQLCTGQDTADQSARGVQLRSAAVATVQEPAHACTVCPEMVAIPPGSFQMGSPDSEKDRGDDEGPVHEVHIRYAFWVSKFPVTRREWKAFVTDSGHKDPSDCLKDQPEDSPVVCVGWQDAQDYAAWLSRKSGQHYRLLSEAEHEYVNRAGTRTAYWWGATAEGQCQHANGADAAARKEFPDWIYTAECNDGYPRASPVGHFPANAFGLYDTTGNVYSWTLDCYHEDYKGAPADGSPWGGGKVCPQGWVVRGGSWVTDAGRLRAAARNGHSVGDGNVGFRVARSE